MNLFRLAGDMIHLFSIFALLFRITTNKSVKGISLKTQELYSIVFIARYLDLFTNYVSLYNTFMKIFFIAATLGTVYLIRVTYRKTYTDNFDTFRTIFVIAPAFLLALIINEEFSAMEVLWTFSIYLEAVAILPQLFLLQRTGETDNISAAFMACLGAYRALYLLNWIYRWMTEPYYFQPIVWVSGMVQTGLYADFFYYYFKSLMAGESKFVLPTTSEVA